MKRLTLLVLLATTATCYGQSSEEILNSIRSSNMLADPVVAIPSYIDEFEQWGRQSNEATQRHFDAIRREEEIEALQQQPQQDDTFYSPIRTKYDRTKRYKQHERSSANGIGQHLTGKSYHTPPAPLHDGSKTGYHKPSGNADQPPK